MNTEELKAIVASAPNNDWTHADVDGDYWIMSPADSTKVFISGQWEYCEPQEPLQSRSDIEVTIAQADEIADLNTCFDTCYDELTATRDANDALEAQNAKLQQERDKAHAALDLLQMQVSITLSEAIDMGDCYEISGNSFNDLDDISKSEIVQSSLVNKLRNQAKGESK